MAKTKISEWDSNPNNNTDIDSINIAEGCAPSGINNAIRELMSQVKDFQQGTYSDPFNGPINGTIGATTPSTGAFTTLSASGNVTLSGGTANGVAYLNGSKVLTSGSALTFDGTSLTSGRFAANSSGYVVNPVSPLFGVYNGNGYLQAPSGGTIQLWSADTTAIIIADKSQTIFQTSGSEQMRLTSTGLGIGTSSPGQKLEVYGTLRVRSASEILDISAPSGKIDINNLAGDPIGFSIGSTERMRIDSSGNLGLGVTPSAWVTWGSVLQGNGYSISGFNNGAGNVQSFFRTNAYAGSGGERYYSDGYASGYKQAAGVHSWYTAPSGTAGNAISFTQAMTLDASGNLGIGTSSPARKLHVYDTGSIPVRFETNTSDTKIEILTTSGTQFIQASANNLLFGTNNTERARIDSSGRFLVNTSSSFGGDSKICVVGPATANQQQISCHNPSTSGTRFFITFGTEASYTERGWIQWNGTTMALTNASDLRLKENIVDAPSALSKIAAIQIRSFDFKEDGRHVDYGVVAQELKEVLPQAVFEGSDNEDGSINKPWSVGLEPVIPVLVKALQEMKQIVDAQAARIAALEAK